MVTLQSAFMAAGGNQIPVSSDNDWSEYNPPGAPDNQSFRAYNPTIEGNPVQILDFYRLAGNQNTASFLGHVRARFDWQHPVHGSRS
ncbi:MAG: hypothetical protein ACR2NX_09620 [Chthoniobacterales bacterium]